MTLCLRAVARILSWLGDVVTLDTICVCSRVSVPSMTICVHDNFCLGLDSFEKKNALTAGFPFVYW
jgi:hypothetical protein